MKTNYELHEFNEYCYVDFAPKAANCTNHSCVYPFVTIRLIRKIRS